MNPPENELEAALAAETHAQVAEAAIEQPAPEAAPVPETALPDVSVTPAEPEAPAPAEPEPEMRVIEAPIYIGVKVVRASPLSRADYNTLRGWPLPPGEDGADEGYLVEYLDGGKPNVPELYAGYVSWSPKDVFERAYRPEARLGHMSDAILAAKVGHAIAREAWNGSCYLTLVNDELLVNTPQEGGATVQLHYPVQHADILADDWQVAL